jgi:hypothetical protein
MPCLFSIEFPDLSMTQRVLDGLRAQLGLTISGRLEDSEDVGFGARYLRNDQDRWVILELKRDYEGPYAGYDDKWRIALYESENGLTDEETVQRLRADILAAAQALGVTAREALQAIHVPNGPGSPPLQEEPAGRSVQGDDDLGSRDALALNV